MGDEDFLAAVEADNASMGEQPKEEAKAQEPKAPEPETKPEAAKEKVEQPRDEHGKFASKAAETPAPQATEPQPEPSKQPEPGYVPIAALLDEREKARAAAERLSQIERQQEAQRQPVQIPDMVLDPEGYAAFIESQLDQRLYAERLSMSERIARIEHGADQFQKAKEWGVAKCDTDPYFNEKVRRSPDPYAVVIEEWKREQAASIPATELEEFRAWKAAQAQLSGQQPPATPASPTPPPQTPSIPPKSLASAPAAGNVLTEPIQSDEEMFAEAFPKRK